MSVEVDGERLDDQEIVGFVGLLLLAGHVTTTALLGNSILTLDEHPARAAELRADPTRVPAAIEEVLRYRSPFPRLASCQTSPSPSKRASELVRSRRGHGALTGVCEALGCDGTEQVLLPLADFVALVDAASRATHGDPDQHALVEALRAHFEAGEPSIPVEDFLAAYDAAHDAG